MLFRSSHFLWEGELLADDHSAFGQGVDIMARQVLHRGGLPVPGHLLEGLPCPVQGLTTHHCLSLHVSLPEVAVCDLALVASELPSGLGQIEEVLLVRGHGEKVVVGRQEAEEEGDASYTFSSSLCCHLTHHLTHHLTPLTKVGKGYPNPRTAE